MTPLILSTFMTKAIKNKKYKFYVYTVLLFNQNSIEYLQPW